MMTSVMKLKVAASALLVLLAALFVASCAVMRREAASPSLERPAEPPQFAHLKVVNGKPFDAMYFRSYGVNPTIDTDEEPVSTFSIDVDTASYTLARSYLDRGHLPEPAAVRVEEFVNAFDYGYPDPGSAVFGLSAEAFPSPNRKGYHVLHLGIRARDVEVSERKPANLVFAIDVSGSMGQENRLGLVKQSLGLLVDSLLPSDTVAIVVYGDDARTVLRPTSGSQRGLILSAIATLEPEGATHAEAGLRLAYELAGRAVGEGVVSRVILCSDGVANVGATGPEALFEVIREQARRGVTLTTVGFGMGNYNDVLMEQLAQKGEGQYAYVDRLAEAKRLFVEELTGTLQVVAKDVKVQVAFDSTRVARYRLLGFENRRLETADFDDDQVDAGEMGAGHTVTALYEVKFRGDRVPTGPFAQLRVRYKYPEGGASRLVEAPLGPERVRPTLQDAAPGSRLAMLVALFAEKLRLSYWARNVTYEQLLDLEAGLPPALHQTEDVRELAALLRKSRDLDRREDRFEDEAPLATMDYDHLPERR